MTTVDVVYRYGTPPNERAMMALGRLREVYGIRRMAFDEADKTVRVEYDATRFSEPVVRGLLQRGGLEILEEVVLASVPLPPPPAEAAPAAS